MRPLFLRSVALIGLLAVGAVLQALGQQTCANTDYDCKIALQTTKIAANPSDPEAYYNRAIAYRNKSDFARAKLDLDKYLSFNITNTEYLADGYGERGWARYKTGDSVGALADYNKAIAANPSKSSPYFRRGMVYAEQGKWQAAIDSYDLAFKYNPDEYEVYYNRGRAYRSLGNYDKAISEFTTYIAVNSAKMEYAADGYRSRGMTYFDTGKYEQAVSDFTKAIQLDPLIASSYSERAKAYRKLNKIPLAEADEAKAAQMKK